MNTRVTALVSAIASLAAIASAVIDGGSAYGLVGVAVVAAFLAVGSAGVVLLQQRFFPRRSENQACVTLDPTADDPETERLLARYAGGLRMLTPMVVDLRREVPRAASFDELTSRLAASPVPHMTDLIRQAKKAAVLWTEQPAILDEVTEDFGLRTKLLQLAQAGGLYC